MRAGRIDPQASLGATFGPPSGTRPLLDADGVALVRRSRMRGAGWDACGKMLGLSGADVKSAFEAARAPKARPTAGGLQHVEYAVLAALAGGPAFTDVELGRSIGRPTTQAGRTGEVLVRRRLAERDPALLRGSPVYRIAEPGRIALEIRAHRQEARRERQEAAQCRRRADNHTAAANQLAARLKETAHG